LEGSWVKESLEDVVNTFAPFSFTQKTSRSKIYESYNHVTSEDN
jgi:hypothetical protein